MIKPLADFWDKSSLRGGYTKFLDFFLQRGTRNKKMVKVKNN